MIITIVCGFFHLRKSYQQKNLLILHIIINVYSMAYRHTKALIQRRNARLYQCENTSVPAVISTAGVVKTRLSVPSK